LTEANATPVLASDSERILYQGADGKIEAINVSSAKKETVFTSSEEFFATFLQSISPDGQNDKRPKRSVD
jgi:hypothetical protein